MFGIGMSEMIIICAVALLVFGPNELPKVVKKIARGLQEVRKASDDLRRTIDLEDDEAEPRRFRPLERPVAPAPSVVTDPPPAIPGSALTPQHGDDAPVVVPATSAVAVGSELDEPAPAGQHADEGAAAAAVATPSAETAAEEQVPSATIIDLRTGTKG